MGDGDEHPFDASTIVRGLFRRYGIIQHTSTRPLPPSSAPEPIHGSPGLAGGLPSDSSCLRGLPRARVARALSNIRRAVLDAVPDVRYAVADGATHASRNAGDRLADTPGCRADDAADCVGYA